MARKTPRRSAWIVNARGFITGHSDDYREAVSVMSAGGFVAWRATRAEAKQDARRFTASGGQLTPDRIAAGWRQVRLIDGRTVYGEVRKSRSFPGHLDFRAVVDARGLVYFRSQIAEVLPLDQDDRRTR